MPPPWITDPSLGLALPTFSPQITVPANTWGTYTPPPTAPSPGSYAVPQTNTSAWGGGGSTVYHPLPANSYYVPPPGTWGSLPTLWDPYTNTSKFVIPDLPKGATGWGGNPGFTPGVSPAVSVPAGPSVWTGLPTTTPTKTPFVDTTALTGLASDAGSLSSGLPPTTTKGGKGGKGKAAPDPYGGAFSTKALKKLYSGLPDFSYPKVTFTPTTWTNIQTPQLPYVPLDRSQLKYLTEDPTTLLNSILPGVNAVTGKLETGLKRYLKTIGASATDLKNFEKFVQNLPSLGPQATQQALAILNPQAASARAAAQQSARFISLLGDSAANLQNAISGNVARQFTNSGQALNLLAQGVSGAGMAPLSQEIANTAATTSPLAQTQTTTVPGGFNVTNTPTAASAALNALQGRIPAQGLDVQAPLATMFGASMAQQLQGGARQQALMALAQGNQNVAAIMAQLPQVQNQQLTQLQNERNANLDRELQALVASGQITREGAAAILQTSQQEGTNILNAFNTAFTTSQQNAGTNVSTANQATLSEWQAQNDTARAQAQLAASIASTNAQEQAATARANAAGATSASQANASLALSSARYRVATQQQALSNYISLYKATHPTTGTAKPLSVQQQLQSTSQQSADLQAWAHGSRGTSTLTLGGGAAGSQYVVRIPKSQPLAVDAAWRNFSAKYYPYYVSQFGPRYADDAMLGIFRSYFTQIPDNWTIENIATNSGPISTSGIRGVSTTPGSLQPFPMQPVQYPLGKPEG